MSFAEHREASAWAHGRTLAWVEDRVIEKDPKSGRMIRAGDQKAVIAAKELRWRESRA